MCPECHHFSLLPPLQWRKKTFIISQLQNVFGVLECSYIAFVHLLLSKILSETCHHFSVQTLHNVFLSHWKYIPSLCSNDAFTPVRSSLKCPIYSSISHLLSPVCTYSRNPQPFILLPRHLSL